MVDRTMVHEREGASRDRLYHVPKWYACYTNARCEKRVEVLLRGRGFDSYLPLVPRNRQWKDRRVIVPWPMFPSYVFARFALRDYHAILTTPGVATVVRMNELPVPIPEAELENVKRLASALAELEMQPVIRPMLRKGQLVRVTDGPFHGLHGTVVQIRGKKRVLVGIAAVGQAIQLDIDTRKLQPLDTSVTSARSVA